MPFKDLNKLHRYQSIYRWKNYGVICDDFDKLYDHHMTINNCQLCDIKFNKEIRSCWRHFDHDHELVYIDKLFVIIAIQFMINKIEN